MTRATDPYALDQIRKQATESWDELFGEDRALACVGMSSCGISAGAEDTFTVLNEELSAIDPQARTIEVGCLGLCYAEPLVYLKMPHQQTICYGAADPKSIPDLLKFGAKSYSDGAVLLGSIPQMSPVIKGTSRKSAAPSIWEHPMMKGQVRIALANCGVIDPENISHYLAMDGYKAASTALFRTPEDVIEEVKRSGLRGRGGAGFPTGTKWEFCRRASGEEKYLICNADEGDPGAFMDRSVLEGDPHRVIEGMIIAAHAIGCRNGIVYCRAEYPLALHRLRIAIDQARDMGLLGKDILSSDLTFDITIKEGAGAFVCGEETAMMASIEGKRGMPRTRPPFPANAGLYGLPTNINNVETLANLPAILMRGGGWYSSFGFGRSRGTKTLSLAGAVARTGLIEVPFGITLKEIIFSIGGGVPNGGECKGVLTGGPSGGCIPSEHLDLPLDYEALSAMGSIMGSGSMIIIDFSTCIVDLARFFLTFTQSESCGKCTPCRIGTRQMLYILDKITKGSGTQEDLSRLERLAKAVALGSLCGLGSTAPNPVLTAIRHFRPEFMEHIIDRSCKALSCSALISFSIDKERCIGCDSCVQACPAGAITGEKKSVHTIDPDKCIRCGACAEACPSKSGAVIRQRRAQA